VTGADPFAARHILHLINHAEALLADGGPYLTDRHRTRLVAALAEVKALAEGMDVRQPFHGDVAKIIALAKLIGGLGEERESIKKRLAIEAAAAARHGKQVRLENIDVVIAEEMKTSGKATEVRKRVNKRLVALGWPVVGL
jgi:hypothetical protein